MSTAHEAEKLVQDLKLVIHDAENLIRATGSDVSEKTAAARERLRAGLETLKTSCADAEEKLHQAARQAGQAVKDHPYEAVGIAAGVGFLIGVLLSRR